MKQKIIIQVPLHCKKCRSKAMKTAVAMEGVTSVSIDRENSRLVIIGDEVDAACLTTSLRKKLSYADIVMVMVEEVQIPQVPSDDESQEDDSVERPLTQLQPRSEDQHVVQWQPCCSYPLPQQPSYICYPVYDPPPPYCSIM